MKYVEITLFTTKPIRDMETGSRYFTMLEQRGFRLEKIGQSEPVRQPYSFNLGIDEWTHEEPGCYVEDVGMIGKAGGIIGKSSKPRFFVQTQWWECPGQVSPNWISLNIADNFADKNQETIVALFKDSVDILRADYGFIGHQDTVYRQHVTGTLKTRLPGVFWFNYFGPKYVEFFTENKIKAFPWLSIEQLNGGLITSLSDSPKKLLDTEDIEKVAKEHLGSESFGDVDEYLKNPRVEQKRRVPDLF
jgi:hypothetical protein